MKARQLSSFAGPIDESNGASGEVVSRDVAGLPSHYSKSWRGPAFALSIIRGRWQMFQESTPRVYIPLHPRKRYSDLTEREARERFDHFVETAPGRSRELRKRLEASGVILDGSIRSWDLAQRWFQARYMRIIPDRLRRRSRALVHDFTALLGEEVMRRNSGLNWEIGAGNPKGDSSIHLGFNTPAIGDYLSRHGVAMQNLVFSKLEHAGGPLVSAFERNNPVVFNRILEFPGEDTDGYARIGDTWIHPVDREHLRYDEVEGDDWAEYRGNEGEFDEGDED